MMWFQYEGFKDSKEKVSGTIWADTKADVEVKLAYQHIVPIHIRRSVHSNIFKKWKKKHICTFSYRLHMLLGAGISLRRGLDILCEEHNKKIPYREIREDIQRGMTLSKCLEKYGFPSLGCTILEAGEASGTMTESLQLIEDFYGEIHRLEQQLISAMTYPTFLVLMLLVFIGVAVGFIFPQFESVFQTMQLELPPLTKAILQGSYFLREQSVLLLSCFSLFALIGYMAYTKTSMRFYIHKWIWHLLNRYEWMMAFLMIRMSRVWGLLLHSGISILDTLTITESLWGNEFAQTLQRKVHHEISQGVTITEALQSARLGTKLLWEMLRIGEETGELEEMLCHVHTYYEGILCRAMKKGEQLLEPIMLSIMGIMIAVLVVAVMIPMFNSVSMIQ